MKPFRSNPFSFPLGNARLSERVSLRITKAFASGSLRPADRTERRSLMKFSELGTLDCVCHPDQVVGRSDRRMSCRVCGHEVRTKRVDDVSMLDSRDIQHFVQQLTRLAKRTDGPVQVMSLEPVEELAS